MANADGTPGSAKLARVLADRMKSYADDIDDALDFGVVQGDFSLLVNSFGKSIPKGSYQVCRHIGGLSFNTGSKEGHTHSVSPTVLKKGDKVLVAWVQSEPVVIDVVYSSSRL